jgi:hypothetical protein
LCRRCNVALGYLQDDPRLALQAAKYLERWQHGDDSGVERSQAS